MYLRTSKNAEARGATEHRRRLLARTARHSARARRGPWPELPALPRRGERSDRDRARTDIARPRCRDCGERAGARTRAGRRRRRAAGRGRERRRSRRESRPLLGPRPAPRARRAPSRPAPRRRAALLRTRHPPLPTKAPPAPGRRPQRPVAHDRRRLPPRPRHHHRDRARRLPDPVKRADHVRRLGASSRRSPTSSASRDDPERSVRSYARANVRDSFRI